MQQNERGIVLLEVMIALAILAVAGASLVGLLGQALREERALHERERTLRVAERVLTATALLSRTDLDRRLGRRPVGDVILDIQRPRPTLYRLAVSEVRSPAVEMLVTVIYRPEPVTP